MVLTLWGMRRQGLFGSNATVLTEALTLQGIGYGVVTTLTCIPMAVSTYFS